VLKSSSLTGTEGRNRNFRPTETGTSGEALIEIENSHSIHMYYSVPVDFPVDSLDTRQFLHKDSPDISEGTIYSLYGIVVSLFKRLNS